MLLTAVALAGCVAPPAQERRAADAASPSRKDAVAAIAQAPRQQAALPPVPVPPPRERQAGVVAPERLVGLGEADVRALIGEPASVREEAPALVWRYASAGCGLEVFFYMDLASQTFRALSYELKPKVPHGLAGSACLASLHPAAHD